MKQLHPFLTSVQSYCDASGISPESLFGRATGNRRLYDRFIRRAEVLEGDMERIARYMSEHPVTTGAQ